MVRESIKNRRKCIDSLFKDRYSKSKRVKYDRKYYQKNKEKIKEKARLYRKKHPDKIRAKNRKYYLKNQARLKEKARIYRENNKKQGK